MLIHNLPGCSFLLAKFSACFFPCLFQFRCGQTSARCPAEWWAIPHFFPGHRWRFGDFRRPAALTSLPTFEHTFSRWSFRSPIKFQGLCARTCLHACFSTVAAFPGSVSVLLSHAQLILTQFPQPLAPLQTATTFFFEPSTKFFAMAFRRGL